VGGGGGGNFNILGCFSFFASRKQPIDLGFYIQASLNYVRQPYGVLGIFAEISFEWCKKWASEERRLFLYSD